MPLRGGEALPDQVDLPLRRRYALLRLLLKRVKDVDPAGELHRVDCPVCIRVVSVDDLHHPRAAEALQRRSRGIGFALLRRIESLADIPADLLREALQVLPARSHPDDRLDTTPHNTSIRILV